MKDPCLRRFTSSVNDIALPKRFTYPFNYIPHPLSSIAADQLKAELPRISNRFDIDSDTSDNMVSDGAEVGKMFGVLVVKDTDGDLGYLVAYSGKLEKYTPLYYDFVPPVYDLDNEEGFYRKEESKINEVNAALLDIENSEEYTSLCALLDHQLQANETALISLREEHKTKKIERSTQRNGLDTNSTSYENAITQLNNQSSRDHYEFKDFKRKIAQQIEDIYAQLAPWKEKISALKLKRKTMSGILQQKLFNEYKFLNAHHNYGSLSTIFKLDELNEPPPSGAGECAAPKLLQYAYLNNYVPVCMAEFWWGNAPTSEIRKHGLFYPACKSKCLPILTHMLEGLEVDENPLKHLPETPPINILFEDDHIIVLTKPTGMLSVPGKNNNVSVKSILQARYPDIKNPMLAHRLDMSTSGIMIAGKTMEAYHGLQAQFSNRSVKKRYTAILSGQLSGEKGTIDLPLRVDLNNRPRQIVCHEHGKNAITHYKIMGTVNGRTLLHLWPLTGRTHQLRVHCAHPLGLNMAILGDDLYGTTKDRLYLHASEISFMHPSTEEEMKFKVEVDF